jgi:hypothetical protein
LSQSFTSQPVLQKKARLEDVFLDTNYNPVYAARATFEEGVLVVASQAEQKMKSSEQFVHIAIYSTALVVVLVLIRSETGKDRFALIALAIGYVVLICLYAWPSLSHLWRG